MKNTKHTGSYFPTHQLWIEGTSVNILAQRNLADLWESDPGESTMVIGREVW